MSERELVEFVCPETGRGVFKYRNKPEPVAKSELLDMPEFAVKGTEYIHGKGSKVCRQIPLHHPDAPRHDKMGRTVFVSQREEMEFMRKTGATNDGATIEEGSYEGKVEENAKAQKILPAEREWLATKDKARDAGLIPLGKDEPPVEQARRAKAAKKRKKKGDK